MDRQRNDCVGRGERLHGPPRRHWREILRAIWSVAITYTDRNGDSYVHAYGHGYIYPHGYSNIYTYAYSYRHVYSDSHSDSYSDCYCHTNGNSTNGHGNSGNNPGWPHLLG